MNNSQQNWSRLVKNRANEVFRRFWIITKHPVTSIVLAIMLFFLGLTFTKAEKRPVFTVSQPGLIARTIKGKEQLKILWDRQEIPNAAFVKVGIWNEGSSFIDKSDISSTEPIRIKPLEKIDILAVQVIKSSRSNLKFDSKVEQDKNGFESVLINIKNDEALEKGDGALFHILYSGSNSKVCSCKWKVIGRIKGVAEGFQQKDWFRVNNLDNRNRVMAFFLLSLIIITITLSLKEVRKLTKQIRRKRKVPVFLWINLGTSLFMILLMCYLFIHGELYSFFFMESAPSWLIS